MNIIINITNMKRERKNRTMNMLNTFAMVELAVLYYSELLSFLPLFWTILLAILA